MAAISTKPYLVRAIYEWCTDSGYSPFIAVTVDEHTVVPRQFVRDGEIVLNISTTATDRLHIGNELLEFDARFGGVARHVSIPIANISAIFARENGHGMAFEVPKVQATNHDAPVPDDATRDDAFGSDADAATNGTVEESATLHRDAPGNRSSDARPTGKRAPRRSRKAVDSRANGDGPAAVPGSSQGESAPTAGPKPGAKTKPDAGTRSGPESASDAQADETSRARKKPRLASVRPHGEPDDDRAASARRGGSITAVPSRKPSASDDKASRSGPGHRSGEGEEPDPRPPAPTRPRLTRVK